MGRKIEEISIVFGTEIFRNGEFAIAEAHAPSESGRETIGIKGDCPTGCMEPQFSYRLYGHWDKPYKGRKTFVYKTFIESQPYDRGGVIRWLQRAPNIGYATATKLWDKFRSGAVEIAREQPEVASAAVGGMFSVSKAQEAAEYLHRHKAMEACTIEMIGLLGGEGFPQTIAGKAIQIWGNKAPDLIRKNPYLLQIFRGVGFVKCDKLYCKLGHDQAKLKRQAYCATYAIKSNSEGHTWLSVSEAVRGIQAKVSGTQIQGPKAILLAKRGRILDTRRDRLRNLWVADWTKSKSEQFVADHIAEAWQDSPVPLGTTPDSFDHLFWPREEIAADEGLYPHQKEMVLRAMSGIIGILGGSPGTGKTHSAAAAIRWVIRKYGYGKVAVAAPTGKAAVRLSEAMAFQRIPLTAMTIHRLLGVESRDDAEGWSFVHNAQNPLPYDFLFIDEGSMIDTGLMASLLAARSASTHLLFIGDVNQLPPVGHGAPLRDMIACKLPYGELTEIRRSSGTIVHVCRQIRDGKPFEADKRIDIAEKKNLGIVECRTPEQQIQKMVASVDIARQIGLNPIWDVQILVPVNKRSKLSRRDLNTVLQAHLNPTGESVQGSPFRVGDKVVNLKNGFFPPADETKPGIDSQTNEKGELFVANGELGEVVAVAEKITTVRLSNPDRLIKIPRGKGKEDDAKDSNESESENEDSGTGCSWDLGYALSCHKSQGSEWPVVLVMLDDYPGARRVCSREWIYTAISRAKQLCLLIGKPSTAQGMCRRTALDKRKTFLVERVQESCELLRARIVEVPSARMEYESQDSLDGMILPFQKNHQPQEVC